MAHRAPRPPAGKPGALFRRLVGLAWTTLVLLLLALAGLMAERAIAPQHKPWTPLRLIDPIGAATGMKLVTAAQDPVQCRAILREAGVKFTEVPPRMTPQMSQLGCSVDDAIIVKGARANLGDPVMTCGQALAVSIWERQVLQPAAYDLLGAGVSRIDQYGSYSCRRIYGRATGNLSQHATANALDVGGMRLTDGTRVSVKNDWKDLGPKGQFLRRVRDQGCKLFGTVLSPDYNAAHHDHLHLDMGRTGLCA